jgi:hypothetical protein
MELIIGRRPIMLRRSRLFCWKLKAVGMSARQMAAEPTARHIPAMNGGKWHAQTVDDAQPPEERRPAMYGATVAQKVAQPLRGD